MILNVRNMHSYYGKSHILQGVDLDLAPGKMACLLGRNGVGKSTTLKSIMGLVTPRQGSVCFKDEDIQGRQPYEIARRGLGYVPEERRIFKSLTVYENLLIGIKKPGTGIPARQFGEVVGKRAQRRIPKDTLIREEDLADG